MNSNHLQIPYSHFSVYKLWSDYFSSKLLGLYLEYAQSFDKDTIIFHFSGENGRYFNLEIKFVSGELFFFESDSNFKISTKLKTQRQFKEIENQSIVEISHVNFDRLICFSFSNGFQLWFKGFGRFGNVILFDEPKNQIESIFRLNIKSDWELPVKNWKNLSVEINDYKRDIYNSEFWNGENTFEFLSFENSDRTSISLIKLKKGRNTDAIINELMMVSRTVIQNIYFDNFKTNFIEQASKECRNLELSISKYDQQISQIQSRRSFKELGDIILAHAHSIRKGISEALVTDYYTNNRIRIKLDPNLNAPENAEKYYRKAKNEYLEVEKLSVSKKNAEEKLVLKSQELTIVKEATNFKETHGIHKVKVGQLKRQIQTYTPYKLLTWGEFEIWIGKNAKSNDELLRLASKNDLWLHVKDFTGSHVIVKQRGSIYPLEVIEKAASLAAFYSKAKNQSLVQVSYALRKFISKSKNAPSGEVNVLKESYIDVEPKDL